MNEATDPLIESESESTPEDSGSKPSFEVLLGDVPLEIGVELGRVRMSLRELSKKLVPGALIPLNKLTGEALDIRVNDLLVGRGEAVALGDRYGIRIVELSLGDKGREG